MLLNNKIELSLQRYKFYALLTIKFKKLFGRFFNLHKQPQNIDNFCLFCNSLFVDMLRLKSTSIFFPHYLFVILLSLFSCNNAEKVYNSYYNDGFKHVTFSDSITHKIKSTPLTNVGRLEAPSYMFISRQALVVYNDNGKSFYNIYTLPSLTFINYLGRRRINNGVHLSPYPLTIRPTDIGFDILDNGYIKHMRIMYNELKVESRTLIKTKEKILPAFQMLNDSMYVVMPELEVFAIPVRGLYGRNELVIFNNNSGKATPIGSFPPALEQTKTKVGTKCIAVNPQKERFMVFYSYFKQYKIFDYSGKELLKAVIDNPPSINYENYRGDGSHPTYYFYVACCSTPNFVYALCNNTGRGLSKKIGSANNSEIHLFDWNGNLLKVYKADHSLNTFTVSEDDKHIYATSANPTLSNTLLVYDI